MLLSDTLPRSISFVVFPESFFPSSLDSAVADALAKAKQVYPIKKQEKFFLDTAITKQTSFHPSPTNQRLVKPLRSCSCKNHQSPFQGSVFNKYHFSRKTD